MGEVQIEDAGNVRRRQWIESATDYVYEHGLIGLSLRPLATALGTSDRMLLYYFGSKDELVAAVLRASNDRSLAVIKSIPESRGPGAAIRDLWSAMTSPTIDRCQRLYLEASALRLFGEEPYLSLVRDMNLLWAQAVVEHLTRSGIDQADTRRVARLLDATFAGLQLDMPLADGHGGVEREQAVADLADAVEFLTGELRRRHA